MKVVLAHADATPEEIRRAYRREAKRWHPDHGGDAARMQALMEAQAVLLDPEARNAYDRDLAAVASSPIPRLHPASIVWRRTVSTPPGSVTVRLSNEGGPVTTIEPDRMSGDFWRIANAIGVMDGDDLVDFVIEPVGVHALPAGSRDDRVAFRLDDQAAFLDLKIEIPAARTPPPRPRSTSPGGSSGLTGATPRPRHTPSPSPKPTVAATSTTDGDDLGAALLALLGALGLLGAPFGIMAIIAPVFNDNDDNILVSLIALAVGLGCIVLLLAGIAAVFAALGNLGRALFRAR